MSDPTKGRVANERKRNAVVRCLQDPEWREWSDPQVAKHCGVHQITVQRIRKEYGWEKPSGRTYKHNLGYITKMNTVNLGRGKDFSVLREELASAVACGFSVKEWCEGKPIALSTAYKWSRKPSFKARVQELSGGLP